MGQKHVDPVDPDTDPDPQHWNKDLIFFLVELDLAYSENEPGFFNNL